ncbi:hypothetical protein KL909_002946 [Ogataea angusta]|nr:hypothetical protein KL909_002946 [Ogataea angusta]
MSVSNHSPSAKTSSYGAIPIPNRGTVPRRSMLFNSPLGSYKTPNSLSGFASSFHRAQSFRSVEPRFRASRSYFQDDEELIDPDTMAPSALGHKISTVLQNRPIADSSVFDEAAVDDASFADHSYLDLSRTNSLHSYAASFLTADDSFAFRQVEDRDGKMVTMLAPRSTVPQTVFNSINSRFWCFLPPLRTGLPRCSADAWTQTPRCARMPTWATRRLERRAGSLFRCFSPWNWLAWACR